MEAEVAVENGMLWIYNEDSYGVRIESKEQYEKLLRMLRSAGQGLGWEDGKHSRDDENRTCPQCGNYMQMQPSKTAGQAERPVCPACGYPHLAFC